MKQSPWASTEPSQEQYKEPPSPPIERQRDDRLSQIDQLMRLSVWANSQVSAYLYKIMDDFPEIESHRHLYASYSFRRIHDLVMGVTTTTITKDGACTPDDLDIVIKGLVGGTPAEPDFGYEATQKCTKSIRTAKSKYDVNNEWPSAEHDAQYITSIYAAISHFAADIMGYLPGNHGYIHHSMVRMLAEKADDVVTSLRTKGSTADTALEPRELGHHDNFIQTGYRLLNDHLTGQLGQLRHFAQNAKPSPTADFETIAMDMDCAGAYLTSLHDGLTELNAAHEWVGIFEHMAYSNMCEYDVDTLPKIDAHSGIHAYLDDFIRANGETEIHPMNARILYVLFNEIKQSHPMPQAPQRG